MDAPSIHKPKVQSLKACCSTDSKPRISFAWLLESGGWGLHKQEEPDSELFLQNRDTGVHRPFLQVFHPVLFTSLYIHVHSHITYIWYAQTGSACVHRCPYQYGSTYLYQKSACVYIYICTYTYRVYTYAI